MFGSQRNFDKAISAKQKMFLWDSSKKGLPGWSREKPVYLYCRSESHSAMGARQLKKIGFQQVHHLRGGIPSWPDRDIQR
jgi:rhodanese-related sulfurtransferase